MTIHQILINPEFPTDVVASSRALLTKVVEEAFSQNREYLLSQIERTLGQAPRANETEVVSANNLAEWIAVDSLSRLRALVGGRFESLKARWQGAGFPLKRKKGDKISDYQIIESGWSELEGWISKQGFSARRRVDLEDRLFEIKKN